MMHFKTHLKTSHTLIDLTPLVDVVFLMLIFFIITSDILPLKSLNIENPTLETNSASLTTQLIVVMDAQNVIYVGSKKSISDLFSLEKQLEEEIAQIKKQQAGREPTLVLSVDRRVEYGDFLRLFSICQKCSSCLRLVYHLSESQHAQHFYTHSNPGFKLKN
ncbi:MAG: biopolymer transporter ExbD [Waddliaceae bacterium]